MGGLGIAEVVEGIAGPLFGLIDELSTSDEEKANARLIALQLQVEMASKLLEYETQRIQMQQQVVIAESKSDSWLTRSWRPLAMVTFLALLVSYWLGYKPEYLGADEVAKLFDLLQIGIGGYIVGRTAEKVAPGIMNMFKDKA